MNKKKQTDRKTERHTQVITFHHSSIKVKIAGRKITFGFVGYEPFNQSPIYWYYWH